ncbi:MAG: recombinase family protein [Ruminococcus sp.]|nr:recombinase family protein [Ruminococcus sp.]
MTTKKIVALYVRVSLDIQVDGYSIEEQLDRLHKYAESKDWTIYKEYIDPGYSGANIDRPAMQQLLNDVKNKKINTVLVYKLDRLSRSQKDTLYLIEEEFLPNGVDFVSMSENFDTSTPFGKAMVGILSVFAQLEREQIKERMEMGRIGRAKAGKWRGGSNPPIGYDFIDGLLVINDYEALQIKKIYELFLQGETLNGIARFMNNHYTNRYSNYNDPHTISKILRNSLYIGKINYKGEEYKGVHEAIIDSDTFYKAQLRYKEISATDEHHYRSPYKGKHLLTGLLFCGNCGARYFTHTARSTKKDKDGKQTKLGEKYSYYKCYTRDGNSKMKKADFCDNPIYKVEYLDSIVLDEIKKLKLDPDYLKSLIENSQKDNILSDEIRILEDKAEAVKKKIDKLLDLYTVGNIPIEDIGERLRPAYEEQDKINRQLQNLKNNTSNNSRLNYKETADILHHIGDNLDDLDLSGKREIVQSLISRIEIGHEKDTIKIYWRFT